MRLLGFKGPPLMISSIVLKKFAALEGILAPWYGCMLISWTVLKQPTNETAGKLIKLLTAIVDAKIPETDLT